MVVCAVAVEVAVAVAVAVVAVVGVAVCLAVEVGGRLPSILYIKTPDRPLQRPLLVVVVVVVLVMTPRNRYSPKKLLLRNRSAN